MLTSTTGIINQAWKDMMAKLGNEIVNKIRDHDSPQKILQSAKDDDTGTQITGPPPPGIPRSLYVQHSLMCHAVQHNHVDLVKTIITDGYHITSAQDHRIPVSPLHIACESGKADVLQCFASQKPDIHWKATGWMVSYSNLKSPLCLLLELDRVDLVEILLPALEEACLEYLTYRTPIHLACRQGALQCAKYFLARFPEDINKTDVYGNTPLMLAVKKGPDIVQLLLDHKARTDIKTVETKRQCLHLLFCVALPAGPCYLPTKAHAVATMLIDAGADVDAEDVGGETPLSLLCGQVRANLHQWVQPMPPSVEAAHYKVLMDCVNLLIDKGAHLDTGSGNLPLNVVLNSTRAAIDMYCGRRASAEESDLKRIRATLFFSLEMLEHLLKKGADPDALNVYLYTPLSQMFVHLYSNCYVDPLALHDIWPSMHTIFLLLLKHGAHKCELKEAFWHPPYNNDVIQMVLNSMPHELYTKQLGEVRKQISRCPPSRQQNVRQHHEWILNIASQPRSLRQIVRALLYQILRPNLVEAVPQLLLPLPINEYILSFED